MGAGRKKVLIVYHAYFPSEFAVGPANAIRQYVEAMSSHCAFRILTLNFDFASGRPLFPDSHHVVEGDDAVIEYVPYGRSGLRILAGRMREDHDVIDIHSGFDRHLAIPALLLHRLGLSRAGLTLHTPHGIFMPIDMSRGGAKKRAYCAMADLVGLYRGVLHVASSPGEAADIRRAHWRRQDIVEIPHFTGVVPGIANSGPRRIKRANSLKMAFVGRIALQKNLLFAIDVVRRLRFPSELHVYGAASPDYWARCQARIAEGTGLCTVVLHGPLNQERLLGVLPDHDVLFHPTLGENFGYAIVESLARGIPVLLSDRSPWLDVADFHAGWALPLADPEAFVARLEELYLTGEQWAALSEGALSYARTHFDDRRSLALRQDLLGRAGPSGRLRPPQSANAAGEGEPTARCQ